MGHQFDLVTIYPLWVNIELGPSGNDSVVFWGQYTQYCPGQPVNDQTMVVMSMAKNDINLLEGTNTFIPSYVLVSTWKNVRPAPYDPQGEEVSTARQTAVIAHLKSKQLLLFVFV